MRGEGRELHALQGAIVRFLKSSHVIMEPIFPGMNPYLENPSLWSEVHSWLIVQLARSLNPLLIPKYRAAVEKRVYDDALLVGIPDVSVFQQSPEAEPSSVVTTTGVLSKPIRVTLPLTEEIVERYLEIREVKTGRIVTVIEVLTPKNKRVYAITKQSDLIL